MNNLERIKVKGHLHKKYYEKFRNFNNYMVRINSGYEIGLGWGVKNGIALREKFENDMRNIACELSLNLIEGEKSYISQRINESNSFYSYLHPEGLSGFYSDDKGKDNYEKVKEKLDELGYNPKELFVEKTVSEKEFIEHFKDSKNLEELYLLLRVGDTYPFPLSKIGFLEASRVTNFIGKSNHFTNRSKEFKEIFKDLLKIDREEMTYFEFNKTMDFKEFDKIYNLEENVKNILQEMELETEEEMERG